jgi:hypothetical protein
VTRRAKPLHRLLAVAVVATVAAVLAQAAAGSQRMLVGIYDEGPTFYDPPEFVFGYYRILRPQVLRVNMYWGGKAGLAVADRRPQTPSDPNDPAYNWDVYDRIVFYATSVGARVLFAIEGTPRWANGGTSSNHAPKNPSDLRDFAEAAAQRYSGSFTGPDGRTIPAVRLWAAWNEPNNPVFLRPQFVRKRGQWIIQSAIDYAKICTAIYDGVHGTLLQGEKVACGLTSPRGNNNPRSGRASVSPLAFLRALKSAGLKRFDAYAHHPYYGQARETPTTKPPSPRGASPTAVTLGNFDSLVKELTRLYGKRPIWITEYGYQTNPPDRTFGVSPAKQAAYLKQAFAVARKNPRIDMMLWFLVRDEPRLSGWQSGLMTAAWKPKPAFTAFRNLPHG